jgi:hypothetical protein
MVMAQLAPDSRSETPGLATGSFTGKELDPDFVAANSENRRYHFPARFYLPMRGMFGQVDPYELLFIDSPLRYHYLYTLHNPAIATDPSGGSTQITEFSAFNTLTGRITRKDDCECGSIAIAVSLDAYGIPQTIQTPPTTPDPPFYEGPGDQRVGASLRFGWHTHETRKGSHCHSTPCCTKAGFKQWVKRGGNYVLDQIKDPQTGEVNPNGYYMHLGARGPNPRMADDPGVSWWGNRSWFGPKSYRGYFKTIVYCEEGEEAGNTLYSITWDWKMERNGYDTQVTFNLSGECSG